MLKQFTDSLIGIDIAQKHACAVELTKSGSNLTVASYAYNRHINTLDLTKKSIVTDIEYQDIYFREITLQQKLTDAEIEKFLHLNIEKYLKHPIKDLVYDYAIFKNSAAASNTSIQLIAVNNTLIQQHISLFKQYNLVHKIIDLDIYALERITRRQAPIGDAVFAVINIDLNKLLIIVINKYKILYTYSELIENINEYALVIKLISILNNIPQKIEQIFLAGQQNIKPNILTIITNKLNLETKIINPFIGMQLPKNIDHEITPALAISCGLALRVNDVCWN